MELAYETFGDPGDPPALLIMGLGMQMLGWPEEFCTELADTGLCVVRFDNRDVGLSTHLDHLAPGDVRAVMRGDFSSVAYGLSDMASDAGHVLGALALDSAHVVGASMGGAIAQTLAVEQPGRVRSLTSIMSSTGDRTVGMPTRRALGVLLSPPARDRDEAVERAVQASRVLGSPGFTFDEIAARDRAARSFDRRYDPAGAARQLVATLTGPDRTGLLRALTVPTLVVHGASDPLVDVSGGQATAAAIPGAELVVIDGMGHDLPRAVWPELISRIAALVARAERLRVS